MRKLIMSYIKLHKEAFDTCKQHKNDFREFAKQPKRGNNHKRITKYK